LPFAPSPLEHCFFNQVPPFGWPPPRTALLIRPRVRVNFGPFGGPISGRRSLFFDGATPPLWTVSSPPLRESTVFPHGNPQTLVTTAAEKSRGFHSFPDGGPVASHTLPGTACTCLSSRPRSPSLECPLQPFRSPCDFSPRPVAWSTLSFRICAPPPPVPPRMACSCFFHRVPFRGFLNTNKGRVALPPPV